MAKAMPLSALNLSCKKSTAKTCWTGTRRDDTRPPRRDVEQKITPILPMISNCIATAANTHHVILSLSKTIFCCFFWNSLHKIYGKSVHFQIHLEATSKFSTQMVWEVIFDQDGFLMWKQHQQVCFISYTTIEAAEFWGLGIVEMSKHSKEIFSLDSMDFQLWSFWKIIGIT